MCLVLSWLSLRAIDSVFPLLFHKFTLFGVQGSKFLSKGLFFVNDLAFFVNFQKWSRYLFFISWRMMFHFGYLLTWPKAYFRSLLWEFLEQIVRDHHWKPSHREVEVAEVLLALDWVFETLPTFWWNCVYRQRVMIIQLMAFCHRERRQV